MNLRLFMLEHRLPRVIRRRMFRRMVRLTAEAFGASPPDLRRLPWPEAIRSFAAFTVAGVERTANVRTADEREAIRDRLYENGWAMGADIRRRLRIVTAEEASRALRLLYGAIGIDLKVEEQGSQIVIRRCAFADVYTPAVCDFISAMDCGVVHAVTGGRTISFTERLTEGARCCRAVFLQGASDA